MFCRLAAVDSQFHIGLHTAIKSTPGAAVPHIARRSWSAVLCRGGLSTRLSRGARNREHRDEHGGGKRKYNLHWDPPFSARCSPWCLQSEPRRSNPNQAMYIGPPSLTNGGRHEWTLMSAADNMLPRATLRARRTFYPKCKTTGELGMYSLRQ